MKILLDECIPIDFRYSFSGHEAHTVQWAGFRGKKNGELLSSAAGAGYQVFLTVDQGITQHDLSGHKILSIVLVRSQSNRLENLVAAVPAILKALETIQPGQTVAVST